MNQYLEAFLLGNAAILGNVCVLPLYPGLLAFLAAHRDGGSGRGRGWLGALVLLGVLSMMLLVGLAVFTLGQAVAAWLPLLVPAAYVAVVVLGLLLLLGRNPFARLAQPQLPSSRNPYLAAYLYGLLLGPLTLPCTGPLIVSAFVLGAGNGAVLADGLLYFLIFGLGFGWPLVALSLVAARSGQQATRWLARHEATTRRASGLLLVGIALWGFSLDVLPTLRSRWLASTSPAVASGQAAQPGATPQQAQAVQPTATLLPPTSVPTTAPPAPTPSAAPTAVAPVADSGPVAVGKAAPELRGISHWLNSEPLLLSELRGKVVLVHFWTFSCYNCANTLPFVTKWYETYKDQGLTIIGVHAPEFGFERDTANVAEAATRFGITYPIAQDNDFATWSAYNNRYWPTIYLIDATGTVRHIYIGEGGYDTTEGIIRQLLAEAAQS